MISKENRNIALCLSSIIIVVLFFQYPSLNLDMWADDYNAFRSYSLLELISGFYKNAAQLMETSVAAYRPMFQVMFHLAYTICGFDSYNLHVLLISLHVIQTAIAFIFFRMLTQNSPVALAGCLLFALNPNLWMHFTWSTEIPAASGMVPFLLSLISLVSYIKHPRRRMILFHCLFAGWAYITKETYVPLFFISILTVIFYRRHPYRQYIFIMGCHLIIFVMYLAARLLILRGLGGYGIPSSYTGAELYFLNYISYINQIFLFTYYITYLSSAPAYFVFHLVMICVMLTGIINASAFYVKVNKKFLSVILFVFVLLSYWFMSVIKTADLFHFDKLPDPFETRPFLYEGLLFIMATGLYSVVVLSWVNRKKIHATNKREGKLSSYLEKNLGIQFLQSANPGQKDTLIRFLFYSCSLILVSGLPMFFLPASRIMNVSALGMGGVFASGFFLVASILGEKDKATTNHFRKNELVRYLVLLPLVFFILNNGFIFRDKYMGPESIYKGLDAQRGEIISYVELYPYFNNHHLTEQGTYIFNKLVSKGFVNRSTGKLNIEKIEHLYPKKFPDRFLRGSSLSKDDLYGFQPSDSKIYPIMN